LHCLEILKAMRFKRTTSLYLNLRQTQSSKPQNTVPRSRVVEGSGTGKTFAIGEALALAPA
jgi:hypothetical protein